MYSLLSAVIFALCLILVFLLYDGGYFGRLYKWVASLLPHEEEEEDCGGDGPSKFKNDRRPQLRGPNVNNVTNVTNVTNVVNGVNGVGRVNGVNGANGTKGVKVVNGVNGVNGVNSMNDMKSVIDLHDTADVDMKNVDNLTDLNGVATVANVNGTSVNSVNNMSFSSDDLVEQLNPNADRHLHIEHIILIREKKTLVLDLDETLVHSSLSPVCENYPCGNYLYDFTVQVPLPNDLVGMCVMSGDEW